MNISAPNPFCGPLGYTPALDGIRGIAILLVIGNHAPLRASGSLLPGGFVGVDLFFVLSGFLITTLLMQEFIRTGSISLRQFYLRRVLRLGPALLAMLIVLCSFSFALLAPNLAHRNLRVALIALFYSSNWVKALSEDGLGVVAHTWSLSAEEQFYLVWPLLLLLLLRFSKGVRYLITVAATIALCSWAAGVWLVTKGAPMHRLFFGLDCRAYTLMAGCILGVVVTSCPITEPAKRFSQKLLAVLAPLSLAGLVAFSIFVDAHSRWLYYFGLAVIALLAAVSILHVLASPGSLLRKFLEMKWLVWIGSISYGLYLWHWPIFVIMLYFYHCKAWTVVLIGLPLTFALVTISYYGMERPILKFKEQFTPVRGAERPNHPAAGNARSSLQRAIGRHRPGVPDRER